MVFLIGKKILKKNNKTFYKVILSFKGTRYLGWQYQKDFKPTVQENLKLALAQIFKSENISSVACGRTDSGVHAYSMTVKVETPFFIEEQGLLRALNTYLDPDIRISHVELSDEEFRPTHNAKRREYFYLCSDKVNLTPFESDFIARFKSKISVDKVTEALSLFLGEHDFKNYMCKGSGPSSTIREIYSVKVEKVNSSFHGMISEHFKITICGNGFLKQMVRLIVGTVINYSAGKVTLKDIKESLSKPQSKKLASVAPACGLYKSRVEY